MNVDHHFEIGKTHTICEDYALSGDVYDGAYIFLSDGCSASPDVDVGARLVALSGQRTLMIGGERMNYDLFGKVTIDNLSKIREIIPIDKQSLDATLLGAWVMGKEYMAHIYGDGFFIHQTATTLRIVHVELESGAPDYLSYHLNPLNLKQYHNEFKGLKHVTDISIYRTKDDGLIQVKSDINPFEPVTFNGLADKGDIIAICSDGVHSFKDINGESIHWMNIIREFMDFKSTQGVFVERRINAAKRKFAKEGVTYNDDISMAAIVV